MFKSKWQKRYEKAMENIEFWREYHERSAELHHYGTDEGSMEIYTIHTAQKMALRDVLKDMRNIAKG